MTPIYKPSGRALEYSPDALALNIYTGCPHRCTYCFAPTVLHIDREKFHSNVAPREGILEALKKQLDVGIVKYYEDVQNGSLKYKEKRTITIPGKLIHLCFSCDPYPVGYDTSITREIIKTLKEAGCHVQILTKGGMAAERDFDLLDCNDWFGVTVSGGEHLEPYAAKENERLDTLRSANKQGIKTWVSCEPVIEAFPVLSIIKWDNYIDLYRIGKLNYHPSDIAWGAFGRECERLCKVYGRDYYLKTDLRKEMQKG